MITVDIKFKSSLAQQGGSLRSSFTSELSKQLKGRAQKAKTDLTASLRQTYDSKARNPIVSGRMRASLGAKESTGGSTGEQLSWIEWGYFPESIGELGGSPVSSGGPTSNVSEYITLREHGGPVRQPSVAAIRFWASRIGLPSDSATAYRIARSIGKGTSTGGAIKNGVMEGLHVLTTYQSSSQYHSIVTSAIQGVALSALHGSITGIPTDLSGGGISIASPGVGFAGSV